MNKLRVGVIGLGMGRHHIAGYQGSPAAEVVAVADPNEARLAEIGEKYGIATRYVSAEEMLERSSSTSSASPRRTSITGS